MENEILLKVIAALMKKYKFQFDTVTNKYNEEYDLFIEETNEQYSGIVSFDKAEALIVARLLGIDTDFAEDSNDYDWRNELTDAEIQERRKQN